MKGGVKAPLVKARRFINKPKVQERMEAVDTGLRITDSAHDAFATATERTHGLLDLAGSVRLAGGVAASAIAVARFNHRIKDLGSAARTLVDAKDWHVAANAFDAGKNAAIGLMQGTQTALETVSSLEKISATASAAFQATTHSASIAVRAAAAAHATHAVLEGAPIAGEVGKVALEASARVASGTLARLAERILPGINIAIAALESINFVVTLRDAKSTVKQKVLAAITALGSILGATNIPIVSQIAGGVSLATGFALASSRA
jgi:hypothetical protein